MSGMWGTWNAYSTGATVAQLIALSNSQPDSLDAVGVDPSNIKDSSSETVQAGDLYYDSASDTYYYVTIINYEPSPSSAWLPLIQ